MEVFSKCCSIVDCLCPIHMSPASPLSLTSSSPPSLPAFSLAPLKSILHVVTKGIFLSINQTPPLPSIRTFSGFPLQLEHKPDCLLCPTKSCLRPSAHLSPHTAIDTPLLPPPPVLPPNLELLFSTFLDFSQFVNVPGSLLPEAFILLLSLPDSLRKHFLCSLQLLA